MWCPSTDGNTSVSQPTDGILVRWAGWCGTLVPFEPIYGQNLAVLADFGTKPAHSRPSTDEPVRQRMGRRSSARQRTSVSQPTDGILVRWAGWSWTLVPFEPIYGQNLAVLADFGTKPAHSRPSTDEPVRQRTSVKRSCGYVRLCIYVR